MSEIKKYKVSQDFLDQAYIEACETWRVKLREKFPKQLIKYVKVGNRIDRDGNEYLIVRTPNDKILAVNLTTGNSWSDGANYSEYRADIGIRLESVVRPSSKDLFNIIGGEESLEIDEEFIREAYDAANSLWKMRIKEEFPEVFKSITVEMGDKLLYSKANSCFRGSTYIVAQTEHLRVCLISLKDGNRFDDPVKVKLLQNILLSDLVGENAMHFSKIS